MKIFFRWYFGINIAYAIFGYGVLLGGGNIHLYQFIMVSQFIIAIIGVIFKATYFHYYPEASKH